MNKKVFDFLISPWIIALLASLIIVLTFPFTPGKYRIEILNQSTVADNTSYFAHDFDHDGNSEKVQISNNFPDETPHLVFRTHEDRLINQWNLEGEFIKRSKTVLGDYNHNGHDEIYVMTFHDGTLKVNAIEPYGNSKFIRVGKMICPLTRYRGQQDWLISSGGIHDLNGDGYGELIFSVSSGFTLQPRTLFAWDIKNDSLLKSPVAGSIPIKKINVENIDDSQQILITGMESSTNNYSDHPEKSVEYSDSCAWLMVFNRKLGYYFPPVPVPGHPSTINAEFLQNNGEPQILVYARNTGVPEHSDFLALYNQEGKLLKKKIMDDEEESIRQIVIRNPEINSGEVYAYCISGNLCKLAGNLSMKKSGSFKGKFRISDQIIDINADGNNDLVAIDPAGDGIWIYSSLLAEDPLQIHLNTNPLSAHEELISLWFDASDAVQLWISQPGFFRQFTLLKNWIYPFRFLYFPIIYFAFIGFIFGIIKLDRIRRKKQEEIAQRMVLLELKSIKNRMSPHFIFNVMSTISNLVLKGDRMEAYNCLTKFSGLLRENLDNSENYSIPLKGELSLVEKFVQLQWIRFSGKFDFNLTVADDVDVERPIPKSLVMTFAENAIKHGLFHKPDRGKLDIRIFRRNSHTVIDVEDNGIGRDAARKMPGRESGLGLAIMDEYITLFNRTNKRKLYYELIDLRDDLEKPCGTLVKINVPDAYRCVIESPSMKN